MLPARPDRAGCLHDQFVVGPHARGRARGFLGCLHDQFVAGHPPHYVPDSSKQLRRTNSETEADPAETAEAVQRQVKAERNREEIDLMANNG